jgi:hypothetical protein
MPEFHFFGAVTIEPKGFAAMTPALQTEAVLLMAERREPVRLMRDATGLAVAQLIRIGSVKPTMRLKEFDRTDPSAGQALTPEECAARKKAFSGSNPAKVLAFVRSCGGTIRMPLVRVDEGAGIGAGSSTHALRALAARGLIIQTEAACGSTSSRWDLTPDGVREADELLSKAGNADE